jgi:hypothetical protein
VEDVEVAVSSASMTARWSAGELRLGIGESQPASRLADRLSPEILPQALIATEGWSSSTSIRRPGTLFHLLSSVPSIRSRGDHHHSEHTTAMDRSDSNKRLKSSTGRPISTSSSGAANLPAYQPPPQIIGGARGSSG